MRRADGVSLFSFVFPVRSEAHRGLLDDPARDFVKVRARLKGRRRPGGKGEMTGIAAIRRVQFVVALIAGSVGAQAETIVLPTFDVVATTSLQGGEIDVAKYPGSVWQTGAWDIQTFNDSTVPDTLARQAPGVTVNNVSGNDFQPDLSYRGFDATPVTGTPEGLAVYQNGVRINEAFGDTVNWDLIPENGSAR
jgi:iron complex outermembrane recepter protein